MTFQLQRAPPIFCDCGMFTAGHTSCSHSFPVNFNVNFVNVLMLARYILIIGLCNLQVTNTWSSRYCKIVILPVTQVKMTRQGLLFSYFNPNNAIDSIKLVEWGGLWEKRQPTCGVTKKERTGLEAQKSVHSLSDLISDLPITQVVFFHFLRNPVSQL